jgi:hypothetical protein
MEVALSAAYEVCPFRVVDVPDVRLFHRVQQMTEDLLSCRLRVSSTAPAARKGFERWIHNPRIDPHDALHASARTGIRAVIDRHVVLCAEDTTLVRANDGVPPEDAGALRSARDRGYCVHSATAVDPDTGFPFAWLGALVWTRGQTLHLQDHKQRAAHDKESSKWPALRAQIRTALQEAGIKGSLIHLNDSEGDAWASLYDAVANGDKLITRATQNRRLEGTDHKLHVYMRRRPVTACIQLTLAIRNAKKGCARTRVALVQVRWARVTLTPSRYADPEQRMPLTVTAISLQEVRPPRRSKRFQSLLLTTCEVEDTAAALMVVRYYGVRWGVEIHNDVLKNALELETMGVADLQAFQRLVAVTGPVAAEIARWVSLSRQPTPPPVGELLDRSTLKALRVACAFHRVPTPAKWTLPSVLFALARIGGADVRPNRPPGWRVVWRGWKRFEDFRRIRGFRCSASSMDEKPPDFDT